ncbi:MULTISPECIES: DctP family TRAP transporter solute-binding subunit [Ensifer]|jgi:tripartite ATP-independent transporter DctP family solute receptor|uniref:DctP family TRAP transporter solute-binding subunit n=1 Tax=Ensifer TaxID=106591 RepID=UPI0007C720C9|nr:MULTISPECIES: DctP family TRAP transporter solute-binding subunit [Ensifer]
MKASLASSLLKALSLAAAVAVPAKAQEYNEHKLKLSYVVPKTHSYGAGVEFLERWLDEKSGGKIQLKGYSDGLLGAEVQSISGAKGNVIQLAVVSTAAAATTVPAFGLFDMPYLFRTHAEADAILDGEIGSDILGKLEENSLIGLCYWENGFRQVTNNKHPIMKLEDFAGLKIRTIENPVFIDTFNTLGANAVPMAFTEVYSALETGAIDGQETPHNSISTSRFYEVQKYVSETGHIYGAAVVLASKGLWDQLNEDERNLLRKGCEEARAFERGKNRENDPKLKESLVAEGMEANGLSPEELGRIQQALKPVYDKHADRIGRETVDSALKALEEMRKAN